MTTLNGKSFRLIIYTFGDFQVLRDNRSVISTRGKIQKTPLALLKVLIAHGGHSVSNSVIMDALWPESEAPSNALSVNGSRLRKLLAVDNVLYQKDHKTTLNPANCWVDALAFKNGCKAMARNRHLKEPGELLELYRGKFLPGDSEEPWSLRMREQLHDLFTSLLTSYAKELEGQKRWQDAAFWYEYGLNQDDLYEPFYHGRMRCYLQTGRPDEALEFYYRCERILDVELSRKPSYAMKNLYRQIIEHTE